MIWDYLKNKILGDLSDIDFERPTGRCGVCGHKTYMIKGSMTEDVCVYCKIQRMLIPLLLPDEFLEWFYGIIKDKTTKKEDEKVKITY